MASELPYTQPGSPYTRPFRSVTLVQEDVLETQRIETETAFNTRRNSQLTYDTSVDFARPEILRPTNPDSSIDSDAESVYEDQPVPIRIRTTSTASATLRPPRNPDRLLSPSSPRFTPMASASTPEPLDIIPSMIPLPSSPPLPPPNYPTATNPRYSDGSTSHYSDTNWNESPEKALYGTPDTEQVEGKKKKNRRKFLILLLILIVLVVAIGGGVGGAMASKNNRNSSGAASSSTTQLTTTTNSAGVLVTLTSVSPLAQTPVQEILPTSTNFNGSILNPIFATTISSGTPIALSSSSSSSFTLPVSSLSRSTSLGAEPNSNSISYNSILTPSSPPSTPDTSPDPVSVIQPTPKTTDNVVVTPVKSPSQPQSTPAAVVALPTPVQSYVAATIKATPAAASPINDNNNTPAQTPATMEANSPVATPAPTPNPSPNPSPTTTTTTQQAASPSVVCVYNGLTILGLNLFGSTETLAPGSACPTNYQQQ